MRFERATTNIVMLLFPLAEMRLASVIAMEMAI